MRHLIPTADTIEPIAQVIDLQEEKKFEKEVSALIELHDFIKAHPDSPVKEISRFMPPVDSRVVSKAIQMLAMREDKIKKPQQDLATDNTSSDSSIERKNKTLNWKK